MINTAIWSLTPDIYSDWMVMILLLSIAVCFIASRPKIRDSICGGVLMIVGAPIFFVIVLFSENGMLILIDCKLVRLGGIGLPTPDVFLTTYIALGASYLLARQASQSPVRVIRRVGWVEVMGFALLAGFEILLHARRLWLR